MLIEFPVFSLHGFFKEKKRLLHIFKPSYEHKAAIGLYHEMILDFTGSSEVFYVLSTWIFLRKRRDFLHIFQPFYEHKASIGLYHCIMCTNIYCIFIKRKSRKRMSIEFSVFFSLHGFVLRKEEISSSFNLLNYTKLQ